MERCVSVCTEYHLHVLSAVCIALVEKKKEEKRGEERREDKGRKMKRKKSFR